MSKLYVIGNVYSDNQENALELFSVLENAGYTLGYNTVNKNSAVIMKGMDDAEEDAEEPNE